MFLRSIVVLLFSALCIATVNAGNIKGAGVAKLEVVDPVGQGSMDAVAFFPSPDPSQITKIGPYQIVASKSAPIADGRYPLVILSHGNMGSMWGHHDLATFLARQGYIVVSVTHPGDNFQDSSRIGATSSIYGRPLQVSAALTAVLNDPAVAPHIDGDRIGFVGFSAGGTTGLILAGAKPVLALLGDYCAKRPDDHHVCEAQGHIMIDGDLAPSADPRIRSFVLLAPLSVVFPSEALKPIKAPVLMYVGERDEELTPEDNAITLARDMQMQASLQIIPNAGHFTFLAPCSPDLKRAMPALCVDRDGVDRAALHQQINSEIFAFFTKTLDVAAR